MVFELDKKDRILLTELQKNSRTSLTELSKKIDMSIDSTKKRLLKLEEKETFFPRIQLRPRHFGYNAVVDIKIKLKDQTKEEYDALIETLKNNPYVVELIAISGEWNLTIVLIARDALDLNDKTETIREHLGEHLAHWSQSLTTQVYKFEQYDLEGIE